IPDDIAAGIATIKISEGNASRSMPIHIVTVNLASNATTIMKNSSATINATVNGLGGLDLDKNNFRLDLINKSPQTISFQGGNATMFSHDLTSANTQNGTANFSTEVRGNNTGTYSVTAVLSSTTCQ